MDEERAQDYLNLIDALLSCPNAEEVTQVLRANWNLVDAGFLQTMTQVAEFLEKRGDRNAANFLIDVARHLAEVLGLSSSMPTSSPQLNFLLQVLQATYDSDGDPQVVYPLLQANLDKLDDNCAAVLRSWATATLQKLEPKEALGYGALIDTFSSLLREFPLGNWACNLEIAITGYEVITTLFPREAFPEEWAENQTHLGIAYGERICGERAARGKGRELGSGNLLLQGSFGDTHSSSFLSSLGRYPNQFRECLL